MKKYYLKHLLLIIAVSMHLLASAQVSTYLKSRSYGASLSLATNGVGLEASMSLNESKSFVLRANGMYLPLSYSNYQMAFGKTNVIIDINGKLGSTGLYLDYHPFKNIFKITGGVAYLFSGIGGTAKVKDAVSQGQIVISPENVGIITFDVAPNNICPYIGLGVGRAIPKSRVGFSADLGVYYIGSPLVNFKATKMLEPTSDQQAVIQNNMDGDRWLPQLTFNITYRIK